MVEDGATILDATIKAGSKVPTLCYDSRLRPFGACRICLVEVEGTRTKFTPSCTTPATEGMKVKTTSDELSRVRKTILELLLIHHPLDCPVCDKAGDCRLQDLVYEYGVTSNRFKGEIAHLPIDYFSHLIERNLNRCILCGKCVRICDELMDVAEISFVNRGMHTKVSTDFDRPLDCEFCGQCIDICPVGALTSKLFKYKARQWELVFKSTICPFCSTGCSISFGIKDSQILEAGGEKDNSVNGNNLCVKGRFGWGYIQSPQRLNTPLIKKDGKLIESTWEEALNEVAKRFNAIKNGSGPNALAGIVGERLTNCEAYLFQKFMRLGIGTNNIDHGQNNCSGLIDGLKESLGFPASPNSIEDIRKAELILLLTDISTINPIVGIEINQAIQMKNTKLIVIHPQKIKMTKHADISLPINPDSVLSLINGLINIIIVEDLFNRPFVNGETEGIKKLKNGVVNFTPQNVEELTGITRDQLQTIAHEYVNAGKVMIVIDTTDAKLMNAATNLALLKANIGKEGTGILAVGGKCNTQGTLDMGIHPQFLPGYLSVTAIGSREYFGTMWGMTPPEIRGMGASEIIDGIEDGKVKALYVVGEEIGTTPRLQKILKSLEFLVVQDIFLTETAKLADLVLPGVSFAEKDGTFTNFERRVQRVRQVIPSMCGLPDWQIIQTLSTKLGFEMNYGSPEEIMDEIVKAVPLYNKMSYQNLENGGIQWSDSEVNFLYKDKFPRRKAKFFYEEPPTVLKPDEEDTFILTVTPTIFHSGTISKYSPALCEIYPEAQLEINPEDANKLSIQNRAEVKVISEQGELTAKVKITTKSPRGTLFLPIHPETEWWRLAKDSSVKQMRVRIGVTVQE